MQQKLAVFISTCLFTISLLVSTTLFAEISATDDHGGFFTPNNIKWIVAPNYLPKGAQVSILEGDPNKAESFTIRLKFPANYQIPPHWHPITERITVISGDLYVGMGDKIDEKNAKQLPVGGFAFMPAEMHHYAYTKHPAIVQLHGVGPFSITYVDPKDDPRKN